MRHHHNWIGSCLVAACLAAAPANALVLLPGAGPVMLFGTPGTSPIDDPELVGSQEADVSRPWERTEDGFDGFEVVEDIWEVSGTLEMDVTRSDLTSTMIFSPEVIVGFAQGPLGGEGFTGFSLTGYAGYSVEVDYRNDLDPFDTVYEVSRSMDGDVLTFTSPFGPFFQGTPLGVLVIKTDAPAFRLTGTASIETFIDEFGDESVAVSNVPAPAPIPLPPAAAMLIAGIAGLGALRRFRRR